MRNLVTVASNLNPILRYPKQNISFRLKIKISKIQYGGYDETSLKSLKNLSPPLFHRKIHFYAVYLYMIIVNLPLLNSITCGFC